MQVRDNDGNIVTDASYIKQRWKEYYEWLLNVDGGRRAELTESDLGIMHELANGELEISMEDVRKAMESWKEESRQERMGIQVRCWNVVVNVCFNG